ncbi:hypothetical protein FE236_01810 [Mariprofundus erugo]|uniref:hypothetical protein n=1 Tax=Mariprofundus erugo TaxID=2528639 RepID=UPI0010FD29CB|nr:hypothetical protein [Mariprofundus erugo]TLS77870.1 hypothetical protein FE236_01810 [Mariprofundus erugo]
MAAYLKLEESMGTDDIPILQDLMGVSLLALLLSPWAAIGLLLTALESPVMTPGLSIASSLLLLIALPKAVQLVAPAQTETRLTRPAE